MSDEVSTIVVTAVVALGALAVAGIVYLTGRSQTSKGDDKQPLKCQLEESFRGYKDFAWTKTGRDKTRNAILGEKPHGVDGIEHYNLLIVGPLQAGKSSFKNTIKSSFVGEICYQESTGSATESVTQKFRIGYARDKNGKPLGNFRFADMPGLEYITNVDKTIGGILDGRLRHNYVFEKDIDPPLGVQATEGNSIHCVVIVIDGTKTNITDQNLLSVLKEVKAQADERGLPVAVILTHLDEVCNCVKRDISKTFNCRTVKEVMENVKFLGIDQNRVFVVQNYCEATSESVNIELECLCLVAVKHLLQFCREYEHSLLDNPGRSRLDDSAND